MAYVIYLYEEESYIVCGYFDLDDYYKDKPYSILYEGCFDDCLNYLERL